MCKITHKVHLKFTFKVHDQKKYVEKKNPQISEM